MPGTMALMNNLDIFIQWNGTVEWNGGIME